MIYADSSAIVKRYYAERGSDLLKSRWVTIDRIFTSRVAYAEIHAALARKVAMASPHAIPSGPPLRLSSKSGWPTTTSSSTRRR